MRTWLWGGTYLGIAVLCGACGDPACEAGRQLACACPGGADGVQVCADDGSAFGACQCGGTGGESVGAGGPGGGSSVGGGGAGGGMVACAPAAVEDCYDGPAGTDGVGVCHAGTRICDATGMWGLCMNQVQPSAEDCQTSDDEDCDGATPACAGPFVLTLEGFSSVLAMDVAPNGDIFIDGQFDNGLDFGNGVTLNDVGAADTYLAKLGPDGVGQWALQAGGPIDTCFPSPRSVATDSAGNVWVGLDCLGDSTVFGVPVQSEGEYDFVVAKLSPAGDVLVLKSFGSPGSDLMMGLAVDANDRVVFAAFHAQPIYFGGQDVEPGNAVALVTLDANGDWVWSHDVADPEGNQVVFGIDPTTDGPVVSYPFNGMIDLGDGPLSSTQNTLLVARYAADGTVLQSFATGGPPIVRPLGGGLRSDGDLVVMGTWDPGVLDLGDGPITHQGEDYFFARYDAAGQLVDKTVYPHTNGALGTAWVTTGDHIRFVGAGGPFDFGGGTVNSAYLVELDANGDFLNQLTYNSGVGVGVFAPAADGVPLYGGTTWGGPWDFNGQMIPAAPSGSAFVVRSL